MLYFTSFRYCLGRRTYIVSDFHDNFKEDIDKLSPNTLRIIKKELEDCKDFGMDCDKQYWDKVYDMVCDKLTGEVT